MTFNEIFKTSFLKNYENGGFTFRSASVALLITLLLSLLIYCIYYYKARKYFFSKEFAVSLVALSVITAGIIITIQTSVVISLGMVGALSIVRFRTAIKNPLDLVFLFWSISIGIVCGAGIYALGLSISLVTAIVVLFLDALPGLPRNRILVLNTQFPYDRDNLKEILNINTTWWNIRTETILNGNVNLIIEVKARNNDGLIDALTKAGYNDISLLTQEGVLD